METPIVLSGIQMVDVFFRFTTTGALGLFAVILINSNTSSSKKELWPSVCLIACVASYTLLTAPIDNEHYGWLRPPLLLFTDCTTYALLAVYWQKIHGRALLDDMPKWLQISVAIWFCWLVYFFLVEKGIGQFHRAHHLIGLLVLAGIFIDAIRGFSDDLVVKRRHLRTTMLSMISAYMLFLTVIEVFFRNVKDDPLFSVNNALVILILTLYFVAKNIKQRFVQVSHSGQPEADSATRPALTSPDGARLQSLMATFYKRNGLSVSVVAEELGLPDHQLRVLINQELGYDNFSHFLNSYRIPAICAKLEESETTSTPILTLALAHGYNSIAPFNRAFKEQLGITPSQYKKQYSAHFQK